MLSKTVRTKLTKDSPTSTETKVTIDFASVTREELEALAAKGVVIDEQAIWRTSGKIPTECTIKVREQIDRPKGTFQPTPESLAARAMKMTPEERAELVKKLQEQEE